MSVDISKVLAVARKEIGYLEKKNNSNLDSKTENAGNNNYTKYWRDMGAEGYQGQPWCNCFVNWCFVKSYGESKAKELLYSSKGWSYYTPTSASYFKNNNQWFSTPKKGDIIYFKNSNGICHIGIVYNVDSYYVYTYEGNTSGGSSVISNGGGVCAKKYTLKYEKIAGYGRPKYDKEAETTTTVKKKTLPAIANPTLRKGHKSTQVKYLQQDLNYVGYSLDVDGSFGSATETALKDFQKKHNLTVDGVYGLNTRAKLGALIK